MLNRRPPPLRLRVAVDPPLGAAVLHALPGFGAH